MRFRFNIPVSLDYLSDDEFVYPFLNMYWKDVSFQISLNDHSNDDSYIYVVCPYQDIIHDMLNPIMVSMLLRRSNSFQERKRRLQRRIEYMVERGPCIFVTLTLGRDDYSSFYVRNSVSKFLRQFEYYVANADWGKLNNRLHYHAVIQTEHVDHRSWPLGLINFERVYVSDKSCKKLAKYVAKLTNHAVKETVKGSRCIYSKNFSKLGL